MELKPCKCGSTNIKLRIAVRHNDKAVYCYQCDDCKRAGYAFSDDKEIAAEIWNDANGMC